MHTFYRNCLLLCSAAALAGCSALPEWLGADNKRPLPGKRISVMEGKGLISADPTLKGIPVSVPAAKTNSRWLDQNVSEDENPALGSPLGMASEESMGAENPRELPLTSAPIVSENRIFVLDGEGMVRAANAKDPSQLLWEQSVNFQEMNREILGFAAGTTGKDFLSGNIAMTDGKLIATTGDGMVVALSPADGKVLWKHNVKVPIKSAASGYDGKVYFITADNQLFALDAQNGKVLWTHSGLSENASIMGASAPVVTGNIVLASYSSGEIYALNTESGNVLWSDTLSSTRSGIASSLRLSDIDATPIVRNGIVYASGNEGVLTAIDIFEGKRVWQNSLGSLQTPWPAGKYLFLLTTTEEIVCVHAPDGRIAWVSKLDERMMPRFSLGKSKGTPIHWAAPVLAGGRLLVVGSHGKMLSLSPADGHILEEMEIPKNITLSPVVVGGTLYLLDNEANLIALR